MVGLRQLWIARVTWPPLDYGFGLSTGCSFDNGIVALYEPVTVILLPRHCLPIIPLPRLPCPLGESDLQVCAGAEHPTRPRQYDGSNTVIDVEQAEYLDELVHHRLCEGIVLFWSVERDHDYFCRGWGVGWNVGEGDVFGWEGGVGGGEVEGWRGHGVLVSFSVGLI